MKRVVSLLLSTIIIVSLFSINIDVSAKTKKYVKSLRLSTYSTSMYIKSGKTIKATVSTKGSLSKKVTAKSNNTKIATVKVGKPNKKGISLIKICSKKIGKVKITVKTVSKTLHNKVLVKNVTITVKRKPAKKANRVLPESIKLNNTSPRILYSGEQFKLSATIKPNNVSDKTVTWVSSNPYVATVDQSGLVTAKAAGTTTINAITSSFSIKASSLIRVNQMTSYIENGSYCFRLKDTNSYLDHQGGVTNGTNVHLWEGDGNSNVNQKINLKRIDDNRYHLWSATSDDLLIDVNRGSSYNDPIKLGLNIDLWQFNDWEAQEWLFTKTYDGYYIIRLNMFQNGALEVASTNNGANIFLGEYNADNDRQKWQLVSTNPISISEKDGWICNTKPIGNVNVRTGPGTNYLSIGGFNENQKVTVIGSPVNGWYKVRGTNRHNGNTITGFICGDYLSFNPPVVDPTPVDPLQAKFTELKKRYVNGQYWNAYSAPDYSHTGTHSCYCSGTCRGNCSCSCGQFYYNGKWVAGQCHGYALRIAYEIYGSNANTWATNKSINSVRPGDIIRFWNNGHSVMVTNVSGDNITFTDCNRTGPCKVAWDVTWPKSKFTGLTCIYKHP
ncbi:MAG: Ig-like domain-containing protein [Ruminococcus sp.]|nr:Ig-like domain-containing protein [Ruminococcus sp.]MDD5890245.1 Ig-like domain-containing protein [Ruminococcus sp.]